MLKLTIQETSYIINLLEFRKANIELEKQIFNTTDYVEYEKRLIKMLKSKCQIIIKNYNGTEK